MARTSARVSAIAGEALERIPSAVPNDHVLVTMSHEEYFALAKLTRGPVYPMVCSVGNFQAMAGSCLRQRESKSAG